MKKKILIAIIAIILLLIFGLGGKSFIANFQKQDKFQISTISSPVPAANPKLEIFSASVFIKTSEGGDWREAQDQQEIPVNTQVKTDSKGRAQIVYPNGTVTRIDKNSQITLEKFENKPFNADVLLSVGRIWSRVKKLLGGESYETKSSTLVASVRGTSFGLGILSDGQSKITVTKHKVHIDCIENKLQADIDKTDKTITNCKTSPKPLPIDSTEFNDEWYIFNNQEDLNLDKRFGKNTYSDEDTVLSASTTKPSPTATPTTKPTPTVTPTPSASPTATPNPITRFDDTSCNTKGCILYIYGSGFSAKPNVATTELNANGSPYQAGIPPRQATSTMIEAYFTSIPAGKYHIKVDSITSDITFTVQ